MFIGFLAYLQVSGNFHTVQDGVLYRSAQPDAALVKRFAQEYDGKIVINLRGASEGAEWYETEIAAAEELGLRHVDFPMSASSIVSSDTAHELIQIMRDAPKPVLVHCKSGSDRTGFASMIYLMAATDVGERKAERQLSIRYGHFSVPYLSAAYPMDESWEEFELSVGITDS